MTLLERSLGVVSIVLSGIFPGLGAGEDEEPPLRTDHATASAPASEPGPADPAAGVLAQSWSTDVRGTGRGARFAFAAGQLLMISPRGVDAYATGDGKARWHYYEPGRQVAGHAVTAGTLVLLTRRADHGDVRTAGLDAATGKLLWRSTAYRPAFGTVQPGGRGIVALADARKPSALAGVDARTGARRWTWPGPGKAITGGQPCRYVPHDSDGALLLIETKCAVATKLYAFDPGTGRTLWQRPRETAQPWAVSRAGLTLAPEEVGTLRLIGRDGRVLRAFAALPSSTPESLAVVGGRAVVAYADPTVGSGRRMASVDLRTGEADVKIKSKVAGELAVVAGRVYGQLDHLGFRDQRGEPGLLAGGLEVIDARTLRGELRPLPSAAASGFWSAADPHERPGPVLLHGGRVYTAAPVNGGLRLTAYAPGEAASPLELGGVPAGDWPDACALGKGFGPPGERAAPLAAGPLRVPGWSCELDLATGIPYRVRVAWVARDAAEADRMLDPAGGDATAVKGVGDEAYAFRTWPSESAVALRVGRYVVRVTGGSDDGAKELATSVARRLKRLNG